MKVEAVVFDFGYLKVEKIAHAKPRQDYGVDSLRIERGAPN